MFTLQSAFNTAEATRESEFLLMKELMKKLVAALEDKSSHELVAGNLSYE